MTQPTPPILVADDDEDTRETLRALLEDAGYTMQLAANGREALELLRTSSMPLVALLDWFMSGLTGAQLLQLIATDAVLAQRHAYIVMSATSMDHLHMDAFLPTLITARVEKPFDIDTLLAAVKTAMQAIRARTHQATQATGRTPVVSRPAGSVTV